MQDGPHAIATQALTKKFGEVVAVNGVDLEIRPAEIFGFLGPNGAGKTTTIRMLCGILRPTSGRATILGIDVVDKPEEVKKRIGYVAQHFGLYGDLSVEENVNFYGDVYGGSDRDYRDHLIESYGFGRLRRRLARNLSGGFKQRLALICALTHKPRLVFLDEPTAGVDPVTRKDLWDLFYRLTSDGTTLFVTTHYMEEAERCDRLAFIFGGRLIIDDTPEGVKAGIADRDVFEARCEYDAALVARLSVAEGIETVNQFGSTLRLIARKGVYTPATLAKLIGAGQVVQDGVRVAQPTIEDVFVNLTRRSEDEAGAGGAR